MAAPRPLTRRTLLAATALTPLAGCTSPATPAPPAPSAPSAPPATTSAAPPAPDEHLVALERKYDARLGVFALNTSTGASVAHRADERFAFCSTFKGLAAAAVLHRNPMSHLDTLVRYAEGDLLKSGVVTSQHVATGMTIRQLCDAAIRFSDGTAGNLLLRDLGGPQQLTDYLRGLGDTVTRMDRTEPAIVEATPGDPRDTATPRSLGTDYQKIVLGDALPEDKRALLRDLMERPATQAGAQRVRAGLPKDWRVADKTGTGDYGTLNDIALVWPPGKPPLLIAIMSSKAAKDAKYDHQPMLAEAASYAATALTR
ncbi:class A beta-lactamase [Kibdelosporangium phytohabitans]|uniref:Beta-lactamase n=1 Tax=Kibdelosporangium phytohabitans TaxID=860235 RepID=A0A0N7F3P6_9PSEU|nr:class A beta-lactamase [Kibdelosporangium phytohabitans]ALG09215.1 class A beta-lactamase [Kibdelosporangium phytohabitans]MBE1469551.1 beta-lactamase class A [Kibdelosporangium phytohabitans]